MKKYGKWILVVIIILLIGGLAYIFTIRQIEMTTIPSNSISEKFGEAIRDNNYNGALLICDTKTPFSGGGDPPLLFTKASCYCYVAKEISKVDITKAVETCNEIENFPDELTTCSSREACLDSV